MWLQYLSAKDCEDNENKMGNKQWRKQWRYHHQRFPFVKSVATREVQTEPVHICESDSSLFNGWRDESLFTNSLLAQSNKKNEFEEIEDNRSAEFAVNAPLLNTSRLQERNDVYSQLSRCASNAADKPGFVLDPVEEPDPVDLSEGEVDDGDIERSNSLSYWGDTSSAELDQFLVAETLCNERDERASDYAFDEEQAETVPPAFQSWSSEEGSKSAKKTPKSPPSSVYHSSKLPQPTFVSYFDSPMPDGKGDRPSLVSPRESRVQNSTLSSLSRPGMSGEKVLEYTFYIDDTDQMKKPFYDRRICALINIDGCRVSLLDRGFSDKKKIYYKGMPVRPVVITAPTMPSLRRCLGRIDTQFPHFNAKAFFRD